MKLFQYWDADPPPEIVAYIAAAAAEPGFEHVLHDEASASAWITACCDERTLAAWSAIAVPAGQSDLLRLLLLERYGGVWADATYRFLLPLAQTVARSPRAQAPEFGGALFSTNYMMVREPGNAFLRTCLDLVLDHVEHRRFSAALMATGPGPVNAVRCVLDPAVRAVFDPLARARPSWVEWGWQENLAVADQLIEPTRERLDALRCFDLIDVQELAAAAISAPSTHRGNGRHWTQSVGRVYR